MPKALERELRKTARSKFKHIKDPEARKKREDAYTFGVMRSQGWKPRRER